MAEDAKEYAGDTAVDTCLWHSYAHQAVSALRDLGEDTVVNPLDCDNRTVRLSCKQNDALRLILHSAMMLEYRLKRVLYVKTGKVHEKTLGMLLCKSDAMGFFWEELKKTGFQRPDHWPVDALYDLKECRDKIAHGNWEPLKTKLDDPKQLMADAVRFYAVAVRAIDMLNDATVYGNGEYDHRVWKSMRPRSVPEQERY
jgi:hypothetical protein